MLRLGIDYGTSTSKMIFRDPLAPGGEKAFCVLRNNVFRVPSSVKWSRAGLEFGVDPAQDEGRNCTWYHSVKMRVAGEATGEYDRYCYGSRPRLPNGITAKDLAIGTIWFLM